MLIFTSSSRARFFQGLAAIAFSLMLGACNDSARTSAPDSGSQGDGAGQTGPGSTSGDGGQDPGGLGQPPDAPFPEPPGSDGGSAKTSCPDPAPVALLASEEGDGTFYDINATGEGSCGLPQPDDQMVAALNDPQYADSAACGGCLAVTGPLGEVVVKVVDRCPECKPGDLDLSLAAFSKIADPQSGRVHIRWREVPCDINDPIRYHFKSGSNSYWAAVQVRNHRNRIARLEVLGNDNQYRTIPRAFYNYFVAEDGLGPGPLTFRVTDIYGNQIEDGSIVLQADGDSRSQGQFPACDVTP